MDSEESNDTQPQAAANQQLAGSEKTEAECEDEHSLETSSLHKDDSGITLEASLSSRSEVCEDDGSCSISSPRVIGVQDAMSDIDMCNDFVESLNDSAVPSSSSASESSSDVKSKNITSKDDCEKNGMALGEDESCSFNSVGSIDNNFVTTDKDSTGEDCVSVDKESDSQCATVGEGLAGDESKHKNTHKSELPDDKSDAASDPIVDNPDAEKEDSLSSLTSSDDDNENKDDDSVGARFFSRNLFRRRRRRLRERRSANLRSDDSSTSDDDDDNNIDNDLDDVDVNDNDNDNEEIQNTDSTTDSEVVDSDIAIVTSEILNKTTPLPNWYAVQELHRREYGCTQRQSLSSFNEKVQGSIQMARRLQLVNTMKYHEGCVNSLCFNRIGTLLASGSDDLNVVLWNWERGRPSLIYDSGHRSNVFQAKFMPYSGDCHVVSCARDGQVRLAELSLTGVCKATRKLAQHKGAAHKLALEYESANVFLSCGEDAVTYLFDLREERPHKLVTTKENEKKVPLYSIHSNPVDPGQFCVGGKDHFIRVYDKRKISEDVDGGVLKKFCPDHLVDNNSNVTCACYNYNGTEILGSYNDEDIYLFDNNHSDGANYLHRYRGHRNNATVKGVNFYGPKSQFVVSGSDCGNLYMWEKQTEAIITFQEGDKAGVINTLEPHPSLPILATSGLDHDVKLWMPTQADPKLDTVKLKRTLQKNQRERKVESMSEPTVMSGQMLWMIMHHFRNTARRRLREEGQELSTSDEDGDNASDDSDAAEMNQCAQS